MKVKDIVVLKEVLFEEREILLKEKHLFKVVDKAGYVFKIKSLTTDIELEVRHSHIRLATLKERYLVDGNVVELENGEVYVVMNNFIVNVHQHDHLTDYNENMENVINKEFAIKKVYQFINPVYHYSYSSIKMMLDLNSGYHKLIWQRKPKITLTDDEKVILKNVDKDYNYIMRAENNLLVSKSMFFSKYPDTMTMSAYNHLFKNITTESGIHEIKELLK